MGLLCESGADSFFLRWVMDIADITKRMIEYSDGNQHDIHHFLRVWSLARTIGVLEGLDEDTLFVLEAAALTHDIACPLCRRKYGNTNGKHQEREGGPLVRSFLTGSGLTEEQIERIAFLVEHHHTFTEVSGADHQILLEADYIANAMENGYSVKNIDSFLQRICRTDSGRSLIEAILLSNSEEGA